MTEGHVLETDWVSERGLDSAGLEMVGSGSGSGGGRQLGAAGPEAPVVAEMEELAAAGRQVVAAGVGCAGTVRMLVGWAVGAGWVGVEAAAAVAAAGAAEAAGAAGAGSSRMR